MLDLSFFSGFVEWKRLHGSGGDVILYAGNDSMPLFPACNVPFALVQDANHCAAAGTRISRMSSVSLSPLTASIKHAKEVVDECIPDLPENVAVDSSALEDRINPVIFAVLSAGRSNASTEIPEQDRVDLWHIVCKLWVSLLCTQRPSCPRQKTHRENLQSVSLLQNACVVKQNESNKSEEWMVPLRESAR